MITIRCDYVDADFRPCSQELSGLAFNAKPANWGVVDLGHGDHMDYCPEHRPRLAAVHAVPGSIVYETSAVEAMSATELAQQVADERGRRLENYHSVTVGEAAEPPTPAEQLGLAEGEMAANRQTTE